MTDAKPESGGDQEAEPAGGDDAMKVDSEEAPTGGAATQAAPSAEEVGALQHYTNLERAFQRFIWNSPLMILSEFSLECRRLRLKLPQRKRILFKKE